MEVSIRELMAASIANDKVFDGEKIKTEDIIEKYPDGIVINDFHTYTNEDGEIVYAYSFEKGGKKYFAFAGELLKKGFTQLMETFGSEEKAREEVSKVGVPVKLYKGSTKSGRPITMITYL